MGRRGKHLLDITMNLWLLSLALLLGGPLGATGAVSQELGYRLGPNDVIRIEVYGEDDLTVEGKISGDGKINFPLLGAIEVHAIEVQG